MFAQQIAIDGPAGAGKSTIAKLVAERLGYLYIDTGAMYRAIALLALEKEVPLNDSSRLAVLAEQAEIRLETDGRKYRVLLNGRDISADIRQPQVGNAASTVSAVPAVRSALVRQQQAMAAKQPVVMDGRDIGTVVLPHAECKVFLTASSAVRAQRRTKELLEKGIQADFAEIYKEMEERDYRDSHRATAPLQQAKDAVVVDSTNLSIEQVVERILVIAEE